MGVVAHAFNPTTREAEVSESYFCEFKASLVCIKRVSKESGLLQREIQSQNHKQTNKP